MTDVRTLCKLQGYGWWKKMYPNGVKEQVAAVLTRWKCDCWCSNIYIHISHLLNGDIFNFQVLKPRTYKSCAFNHVHRSSRHITVWTANSERWLDNCSMLDYVRKRCANIKTTNGQRIVFAGIYCQEEYCLHQFSSALMEPCLNRMLIIVRTQHLNIWRFYE